MRAYVTIADVVVTEGDSGLTTFTTTVGMNGWAGNVTVKLTATPATASESDYVFSDTVITLNMASGNQTITGSIVGDLEAEGDEYFTLTATFAGDGGYVPLVSSGGKVTIKDDDQARDYRLYVDSLSSPEGRTTGTIFYVPVRLDPPAPSVVLVSFETQDKTATSGQDYRAASGTLEFAARETLQRIPIEVYGDATWEMDESFSVILSEPSGARLGVASADITLLNDDPASVPSIADLTVDEGNLGTNEVIVTVTFDRPVPELAMLWYQFLDGAAVAGQDFSATGTTLYPQPGVWQMTFPIEILPDTQPECDEGFFIRYGGYYGIDEATRSAKILIRDDDGKVAGCGDPFASAAPPEGPDGGAPPAIEPPNDGGSMPDGFIIHMPVVYQDAAVASADASDAASGPRIKSPAGCACALGRDPGRLSLLLVAVTGMGIALVRRRGRR